MSSPLPDLLRTHSLAPPDDPTGWLAALGRWLLHEQELVIDGTPCRILEVEAYLSAPWHRDPFAHRHVTQAGSNGWYFHRTGDGYCGGTYKGLDLTFGHHSVYGGLLVRAVQVPDGQIIEGPCRLVDHVLAALQLRSVFELDVALCARLATDPRSPLHLRARRAPGREPVLATARVGLTLRRATRAREMPAWWLRRYRWTTAPAALVKARIHQVAALAADGHTADDIATLTGARPTAVRRWLEDFARGRSEARLTPFIGQPLRTSDLAYAHGAWLTLYGGGSCT